MSNTKENPVPSINNLLEKIKVNFPGKLIDKDSLINFLNGVETNKVQPKCKKCEFNGDYMDARCKHCNKQME